MELDEKTLASVKEAVAKIRSEEMTVEEAAQSLSIDQTILEQFLEEEVQGEKLKNGKKKDYDDASSEPAAPTNKPDQELKRSEKQVKEESEFDEMSDEELEEALALPSNDDKKRELAAAKSFIKRFEAKENPSEDQKKKYAKARAIVGSNAKKSVKESVEEIEDFQTTVSKEDLDESATEHLAAFFKNETDLSEDFKSKIATLFEGAVISTAQKIVTKNATRMEEQLQEKLEEKVSALEEETEIYKVELDEKVNEYLAYVVENWKQENKPAITSNIRSELTESFILGLRTLFEEHYIDIPEEKVNVVEDFSRRLEETENEVARLVTENAKLSREKTDIQKSAILEKVSINLSETEKEKFNALAESVEFKDLENFETSLETIRESYFDENAGEVLGVDNDDGPLELQEDLTPEASEKQVNEASSTVAYMSRALRFNK